MRGAPARAIQDLAGHQDLSTTQRHMQRSPAALWSASIMARTGAILTKGPSRGRTYRSGAK
jgi:hypothetical protein